MRILEHEAVAITEDGKLIILEGEEKFTEQCINEHKMKYMYASAITMTKDFFSMRKALDKIMELVEW